MKTVTWWSSSLSKHGSVRSVSNQSSRIATFTAWHLYYTRVLRYLWVYSVEL